MNEAEAESAAWLILDAWRDGLRIKTLPESCRPLNREQGYAVLEALVRASGEALFGWKIAATSEAGQLHIGVDAPIAGPLLEGRVLPDGAGVPLANNLMGVAEAEFAFRLGRTLPSRKLPYGVAEVMDAVDAAFPAIEIPDSRFEDFASVGAAQLIADAACASWFVLGGAFSDSWREVDLSRHGVSAYRNGEKVREGSGANVLGDPRVALAWFANELSAHNQALLEGHIVTTGTCVQPFEIAPGDLIRADFGVLGGVEATLT